MFGLFGKKKKRERYLFKVQYIPSCRINVVTYEFNKGAMLEHYVIAHDEVEAGVEFAKYHTLSPNLCICRISKCSIVYDNFYVK